MNLFKKKAKKVSYEIIEPLIDDDLFWYFKITSGKFSDIVFKFNKIIYSKIGMNIDYTIIRGKYEHKQEDKEELDKIIAFDILLDVFNDKKKTKKLYSKDYKLANVTYMQN